ncbi:MAG: RDD family protein [Oligoflexia bacterium]
MNVLQFAGFWRRFWAFAVDSLLIEMLAGRWVWLALWMNGTLPQEVSGRTLQWLGGLASAMIAFAYWSVCYFYWGQTIGKKLLGVRVVDARSGGKLSLGQAMGRAGALFVSYLFLMIGFLMAAFDSKKRTLHDRLARTLCVRVLEKQSSHFQVG